MKVPKNNYLDSIFIIIMAGQKERDQSLSLMQKRYQEPLKNIEIKLESANRNLTEISISSFR